MQHALCIAEMTNLNLSEAILHLVPAEKRVIFPATRTSFPIHTSLTLYYKKLIVIEICQPNVSL